MGSEISSINSSVNASVSEYIHNQNLERFELKEAISTDNRDNHPPLNAIDGNIDTYFALRGCTQDGYWKSNFNVPGGINVTRVEVMSANIDEDEASEAIVFVGDHEIGILPKEIEKSKLYPFKCYTENEDFVKIVTGRNDNKLTFANVYVYSQNGTCFAYVTVSMIRAAESLIPFRTTTNYEELFLEII